MPFQLDLRLAEDTIFLGKLALCELRLMNDSRWPWLVLLPVRAGAVEVHDLSETDQALLAKETALAAKLLKSLTNCEKINSATLGNIVRQLHVHVIARSENDPNWPGPVWGFGKREPYADEALETRTAQLKSAFGPYFS
jgi:diadenosine tetraphosphate (Ap4A) HIT family hydrolase